MSIQPVSSATQATVLAYFRGERGELLTMVAGCFVFSFMAVSLFLAARSAFTTALMATVIICAVLLSAGGMSLLVRDSRASPTLVRALDTPQRAAALAEEQKRVVIVLSKFKFYRAGAVAIGVAAMIGLLASRREGVHGVAAGLLLLVPAQIVIDHFAEQRAGLYLERLKAHNEVQPIRSNR